MATKKSHKKKRALTSLISTILLVSLNFIITIFVILNSIELLFIKDIPLINSISKFPASEIINEIQLLDKETELSYKVHILNEENEPVRMRLGSIESQLALTNALSEEGSKQWLIQQNKGHFLNFTQLDPETEFYTDHLIVYSKESWRTINRTKELTTGDLIFVETNKEKQLIYKILNKQTIKTGSKEFTIPEDTGLTLIISDEDGKSSYFFNAELITSTSK